MEIANKKRPCLLISEVFPPQTGGSGRWFWEVYRRLLPEEAVVIAGQHPRQDEFDAAHSLRLHRISLSFSTWSVARMTGLRQYFRSFRQIRRIAKQADVGTLHCGRCLPEGILALAMKRTSGLNYLCYVHGEEINYATGSRELRLLAKTVFKNASLVIANSSNTKRLLEDEWDLPPEKVRLLHPGVDAERFQPVAPSEEVRRELGWNGRRVVLTVGRLQRRKGHDQMILAMRQIRQAVPDALYAVVGEGEELPRLKQMVADEKLEECVTFMGELSDEQLIRCYQQCDLFALPNRQVGKDIEGFGMVLVEAQACGKPVVAGASGGTADTMQVPETGRIVPCETPDQLGPCVAQLLADDALRETMGMKARQWAVERFDWRSLTESAREVFSQVPNKGRRRSPQATTGGVPNA